MVKMSNFERFKGALLHWFFMKFLTQDKSKSQIPKAWRLA